jgi:diguanylate cyclase (GGDEF)-like protein/PAS domain S-box-containing protein
MADQPGSTRLPILSALLYLAAAAGWFWLADPLLRQVLPEVEHSAWRYAAKACVHILFSGLFLYHLLKSQSQRSAAGAPPPLWLPFAVLFLLLSMLAMLGHSAYMTLETQVRISAEHKLSSIATLKVGQIGQWLRERRGDAMAQGADSGIARDFDRWLQGAGQREDHAAFLAKRLATLQKSYGYRDILLMDTQGKVRFATPSVSSQTDYSADALAVARSGRPELIDFHRHGSGAEARIVLGIMTPLTLSEGAHARVVGVLFMLMEGRQHLFPLIQSWPYPSASAENLLVRREGDLARVINKPRHMAAQPLDIAFPIGAANLPAALAAAGKFGLIEQARDYRGLPVLAFTAKVPGTPWAMTSKIDEAEAFAPARAIALSLVAVLTAMAFTFSLVVWRWWRELQGRMLHRIRDKEQERDIYQARLESLIDNAGDIVLLMDEHDRIIEINEVGLQTYGYRWPEIVGQPAALLRTSESVDDAGQPLHPPGAWAAEAIHRRKDGNVFPVEAIGWQIEVDNRRYYQCVLRDISARKQAEHAQQQAAQVFNHSGEAIMITDADNRIIQVNPAFTEITGYAPEEVIGKPPGDFKSNRQDGDFYRRMWSSIEASGRWHGELWNRRKDGEAYPAWMSISVIRDSDGEVINYIALFTDLTSHKQSEERIRELAHIDSLTGLPNRALLEERMAYVLSILARRGQGSLAVLFMDLDRFKTINDSLGHRIGDFLLKAVGERLLGCVREEDTVARLGGDEFVLLLPDATAEGAAELAERVIAALARPYRIEDRTLSVTPSLGIAMYPDNGVDYDSLTRCADTAMYRAKRAGGNGYQFFTQQMHDQAMRRLEVENGLRQGLERGEFVLHFQPQIRIADRRIVGAEALVRWCHPEWGLAPPNEFIPVAEESGLILPLGDWIMEQAIIAARSWRDAGHEALPVAVNLSVIQLRQRNLGAKVHGLLERHDLPANCLELEITESIAMQDAEYAVQMTQEFDAAGVRLSIDDFGAGYSSLAYLKRLRVQRLKIDASFVRDLPGDSEDAAIVNTIIRMARSLGLDTIAEGVETQAQADFLRERGCDVVQGYFYGRPMPVEDFMALLSRQAG